MSWLSIMDYSIRHRVSLSTIRRRIRGQVLEFKMEAGRYQIKEAEGALAHQNVGPVIDPSTEAIQILVQELKKAYGTILSEKEEMIGQLKNEIDNLKKMNQFLENQIQGPSQGPELHFEFDEKN